MCLHGKVVSPRKHFILLNKVKPGQILVVGKVDARLGRLLASRPFLHRADDVGYGLEEVAAHEPDPAAQRRVFEK